MNEAENLVTRFLETLVVVEQSFILKAASLRRERSDLREATGFLQVGAERPGASDAIPEERPADLFVEAYVEADAGENGTVRWWLVAHRQGTRWKIDRVLDVVTVETGATVIQELTTITCADTDRLVEALPGLGNELLDLPFPPSTTLQLIRAG